MAFAREQPDGCRAAIEHENDFDPECDPDSDCDAIVGHSLR